MYKYLSVGLLGLCVLGACTNPNRSAQQTPSFKERKEWRTFLGWNEACEQAYQSTKATDGLGVEVYPLEKRDALVRVLCAVGSYQPSFLLYRLKGMQSNQLQLETYTTDDGEHLELSAQTELWGEVFVNTKTRTLSLLNAARQTIDCGTWAEYSITKDTVQLQTLYSKLPCAAEIVSPVSPENDAPPADWKRLINQ